MDERTQALAHHTRALQESEKRFRQLAENIREVFWMIDPRNGKFLYVSPAFQEIWKKFRTPFFAIPALGWRRSILTTVTRCERRRNHSTMGKAPRANTESCVRMIPPVGYGIDRSPFAMALGNLIGSSES